MSLIKIIAFIFLSTFLSCKQKNTNQLSQINKDSLAFQASIKQRDSIYFIFENKTIDTSQYLNFPIWNSKIERYNEIYLDTFSIAGNRFRLISPCKINMNGGSSVFLQQQKNNLWVNTNIIFEDFLYGGNLDRSIDVNNDGYKDITMEERYTKYVCFFNPKTRSFVDTIENSFINIESQLLDSVNNIFCDFEYFHSTNGIIKSGLYTYQGFQQYYLYSLEFDISKEQDTITSYTLYKCFKGSLDSIKLIKKTKYKISSDDIDSFNYKDYWQKHYKQLLNIH